MTRRPMYILRDVWQGLGLRGHCYCREIRGAYRDLWIVHHGRRYDRNRNDYKVTDRFVKRGRTALRKAGYSPKKFLFELDYNDSRIRRGPGMGNDPVTRLKVCAMREADMLPRGRWPAALKRTWESVQYKGDRVEMWERVLERSGDLYRVIDIAWSTNTPSASSYETTDYIGAMRGAWLFF